MITIKNDRKSVKMKKNKYLVLIGLLSAQLTIAALYAWSIFGVALVNQMSWSENEVLSAYFIAQFVFALTTILSGRLIDRKGPRITLLIGGLLYGGGLMLSSLAKTPEMLYLTYGVISGAGIGFVYVCPLATLVKWFPNHKGAITGLSVAVFGGGSILFKEIKEMLLMHYDISHAFLVLGIISTSIIIIGALFVGLPPDDKKVVIERRKNDYTTLGMMKTGYFKKIWIMYLLAVIPGLLVLGAAKNIGLAAQLTVSSATSLIMLLAISNAGSRLISGALSDRFGTMNVLRGILIITILSLLTLGFFFNIRILFYLGIIGIAIGYGGFLSLFPTITNQKFGSYHYGSNYGVMFQAYGLAALIGIVIKSLTQSYASIFIISAIAVIFGFIISFTLKSSLHLNVANQTDIEKV